MSHKGHRGDASRPECVKDIIKIKPISWEELNQPQNIIYELTDPKMRQKLELLTAAYFCGGIELWNMQVEAEEARESLSPLHHQPDVKYTWEDLYTKSELFLSKTISVIVWYLDLEEYSTLLENVVEVYQRKFEGEMMAITEENSESVSFS